MSTRRLVCQIGPCRNYNKASFKTALCVVRGIKSSVRNSELSQINVNSESIKSYLPIDNLIEEKKTSEKIENDRKEPKVESKTKRKSKLQKSKEAVISTEPAAEEESVLEVPATMDTDISETKANAVDVPLGVPTEEYLNGTWDRGGRTVGNSLTPLQEKIRKLVNQNPNCVSLVQVGSFYELYFNQAEEYAPKLGIKLAIKKTSNFKVPMAGFPVHQLEKYVKMLVHDLGESVAIVDQVTGAGSSVNSPEFDIGGLIHRRVSRIITPGTLIDESFMHFNQNNYLLSIALPSQVSSVAGGIGDVKHIELDSDLEVGLAWCDLSLGEFNLQQTTLGELMSDITRINPSEIILPKNLENNPFISDHSWLKDVNRYFVRYQREYADTMLNLAENYFKIGKKSVVRQVLDSFSKKQLTAMQMILGYIAVNVPEVKPSFGFPKQHWNSKVLQMDPRTRDALELNQRLRNNSSAFTLFSTIRRTLTDSGTRMLRQWISSPIMDIEELVYRQDFVELFQKSAHLRLLLRENLSELDDFVRSVQRLSLGVGDTPTHLISVANGLIKAEHIKNFMDLEIPDDYRYLIRDGTLWKSLPIELASNILNTFECDELELLETAEEVQEEILPQLELQSKYDESIEKYRKPTGISTGKSSSNNISVQSSSLFSVKKNYNPELEEAHQQYSDLQSLEAEVFENLTTKFQILDPKIKIIKKSVHGKHTDVLQIKGSEAFIQKITSHFLDDNIIAEKRKTTLIIKPYEWRSVKDKLERQIHIIRSIEERIIGKLRRETLDVISEIRDIGRLMDFLDVCSSFSVLAIENNLVRPTFLKSAGKLDIKNGRHIVVESGMKQVGDLFIPNDTKLDVKKDRLLIITGPNMGGKSTFLRQNALIVILAQIGCFVPADSCKMGLVDRIFTRIGASDDISRDLSTFMVEMVETSNILANATEKSLAIVDELGRGTSGKEGLAIAYGSLVSLLEVNKCRTMFATHFGKELNSLLKEEKIDQSNIKYLMTGIKEGGLSSNLVLDHKLQLGISERSYALEVAKMAGFPDRAVSIAARAFEKLNRI